MNKFKEGDIIVKDGYTYVCRIVGETESYFEHRWFKGLCITPENAYGSSGCGGHGEEFSCNKNLILFSHKCKYSKTKKNAKDYFPAGNDYPVIGSYIYCEPHALYLNVLEREYPVFYKQYIEFLYKDAFKDVKQDKVKTKKVKK